MLIDIPEELIPYVRMSQKHGLVCSENMPEELQPLFETTKASVIKKKQDRLAQLEALISDSQ